MEEKKVKSVNITLPSWILSDIIGETKNRSGKIVEYIIKGFMADKDKKAMQNTEMRNKSAFFPILTDNLKFSDNFPKYSL